MKMTLCLLFLICATAALAQNAPVLPNQSAPMQMADHTQRATQHDLAPATSLLENTGITYAQGERPLWEFGPVGPPPIPLGDAARAARIAHAHDKKAQVIWEK